LCLDTSGVNHSIGEPIDELPPAEEAIGSTAAWPPGAKGITAIINLIILAVNLVNLAIASLYFRP